MKNKTATSSTLVDDRFRVCPTVMIVRSYGKILTTSVFELFCGSIAYKLVQNQLFFFTSDNYTELSPLEVRFKVAVSRGRKENVGT